MVDHVQARIPELRATAAFIRARAEELAERVALLDRGVGAELLADGWRGKAASAYDESWVEWKAGADKFVAALGDSAVAIETVATELEAQDADRTTAIGDLQRGL